MELKDLKKQLDDMGHASVEMRKSIDEMVDNKIKGLGVSELKEKQEKINKTIDMVEALKKDFEKVMAAGNRTKSRLDSKGNELPEDWDSVNKSYNAFLRKGDVNGREAKQFDHESKSLSVVSDSDGGYTVTADMSGRIIKRVYETSNIRDVAAVQTISTDALEGMVDQDQASSGWVNETGARPATGTPTIGKWRIPTHEQYAAPIATQKLLDDSAVDIESWIADKVADKFSRTENLAFVLGTGVGQPRGFLTYPTYTTDANTPQGKIEQYTTATSAGFTFDDIMNLEFKLKGFYRPMAQFGMARQTIGYARTLKTSQGVYLWQPSMTLGVPSTMHGYQVNEFNDMPALAGSALAIVFGDFKTAYQIVDRQGVRVLRDPYTNKPYVIFYTTKRVGGDVVNFEAIKILKCAP